jgi:uncharacterized membrane protein
MMSRNRQDTKDHVRSELDYDVLHAEVEIQSLSNKPTFALREDRRCRRSPQREHLRLKG